MVALRGPFESRIPVSIKAYHMLVKRWEVHLCNRSVDRPVYATEKSYV